MTALNSVIGYELGAATAKRAYAEGRPILDVGAGEAHVKSTRGFEVGSLVRIYDRENSDYVVLTEIGDRLIKWGKETPVNRRHRAAAPTVLLRQNGHLPVPDLSKDWN